MIAYSRKDGGVCLECGDPIPTDRKDNRPNKYCSRACYLESTKKKVVVRTEKVCSSCGELKAISDYHMRIRGKRMKPRGKCRNCFNLAKQASRRQRLTDTNSRLKHCLKSAQTRARKVGREFTITLDDVFLAMEKQGGRCYYSGIKFSNNIGGISNILFNHSIDRVDSSRGYTPDNIVLCCVAVNRMKLDLPVNTFKSIISSIYSTLCGEHMPEFSLA